MPAIKLIAGTKNSYPGTRMASSCKKQTITSMEPIHDRMPVIIDREQWATWLSPQVHQAGKLQPVMQ